MITIGYARVSKPQQNIERQIRNIRSEYPDAIIVQERYSGTTVDRPEWNNLMRQVTAGKVDRIVFDSVSRLSRNAEEGLQLYDYLMQRGVELIFLKEPSINTSVYKKALADVVPLTGTMVDDILEGVNKFLRSLQREQIRAAFLQSEKEVEDNRQRTREGIETARIHGKQIGRPPGSLKTSERKKTALAKIKKYSQAFGGTLNDAETMKIVGVSKGTYYQYKRELIEQQTNGEN